MMTEGMSKLISSIKGAGLRVYGPEILTSHVYFTDGTRVGYAQYTPERVYYASMTTGTGFDAHIIDAALSFAAEWTTKRDKELVPEYRDFETFRSVYQTLIEY